MNSAAGKSAPTARARRKFRSKLERRNIAEEASVPGASVSSVAKAHGVRPNQVRHWRRLYGQGLLDEAASTTLVPVRLTSTTDHQAGVSALTSSAAENGAKLQTPAQGTIRIETEKARVYLEGAAAPSSLRVVLEYLLA